MKFAVLLGVALVCSACGQPKESDKVMRQRIEKEERARETARGKITAERQQVADKALRVKQEQHEAVLRRKLIARLQRALATARTKTEARRITRKLKLMQKPHGRLMVLQEERTSVLLVARLAKLQKELASATTPQSRKYIARKLAMAKRDMKRWRRATTPPKKKPSALDKLFQ